MKFIIPYVQFYLCVFIITSFLPHKSLCADPQYEACVPKYCGKQSIRFPFYIEHEQESYCGYPGFNLTCINNEYPILEITQDEYRVDEISYGSSSLRVSNAALWSSNTSSRCILPQIRNLNLQDDRFERSNNLSLALLMNCSWPLPDQLLKHEVSCTIDRYEEDRDNWGLLMNRNDANFSYGIKACTVEVAAPVVDDRVSEISSNNYVELLRKGFDLKWTASNCSECEASGGHCGFDAEGSSYNFRCYCPDRLHSGTCKPILDTITLFKCLKKSNPTRIHKLFGDYQNYSKCNEDNLYYRYPIDNLPSPQDLPDDCSVIQLPLSHANFNQTGSGASELFRLLSAEFTLQFCSSTDSQCQNGFHCANAEAGKASMRLILGTAIPGAGLIIFLVVIIIWRCKKWSSPSTYFLPRKTSSNIEDGSSYYGVPVFSYKDLEEATHNFDPSKELGDGGFGIVYHGKLRDGREVAVKRLYEHNYKRVEQFMNEIEILTCLRHRNLVLLYGSTSHRSRELLLVYEYIPNGTVADHLHGDKAETEPLTWPVRMNIAIETASALSYLHKSDIIHRDVKTNNILLDNNFCVKVADFGLSRLFPTDVTHVSTAPQGTPGYLDPEYHQCYQLTDKSDVYSFGVVLIELISSLPAVDISRQRKEINLANLAIDRIQRCAFGELIDLSLGHKLDANIERMTTSVAELAFRCLQRDKDLRPTMDEVLDSLKQIQGVDVSQSGMPPPSSESENVVLLKEKKLQDSPVGVADKWMSSRSTTPSTTG